MIFLGLKERIGVFEDNAHIQSALTIKTTQTTTYSVLMGLNEEEPSSKLGKSKPANSLCEVWLAIDIRFNAKTNFVNKALQGILLCFPG